MARFSAHGEFSADIEGRLVVIHATGPFNLELTRHFEPTALALAEHMRGAPWGVLVVAQGEFLLTPEAEAAMRLAEARYEAAGRCCSAFVLGNQAGGQIARAQWRRVHRDNAREPQFFDDEASARQWLAEALDGHSDG